MFRRLALVFLAAGPFLFYSVGVAEEPDNFGNMNSVMFSKLPKPNLGNAPQQRQRRGNQPQQDNEPLNAAKVRRAIREAIDYLKSKQFENGSWDTIRFKGDSTALSTLALINAGVSVEDASVKNGLKYIREQETTGTYFVSLRIMAFAAADPNGKVFKADIKRDVKWLLETRGADGGWSYGQSVGRLAPGDASNSQFALLALHEASQLGIKIPDEEWEKMQKYWLGCRRKFGGFGYYRRGKDVRGSMTCAGISSLIIISENLADPQDKVNGEFANCCDEDDTKQIIDKAFEWLAQHYSVRRNPGGHNGTVLYYLYGLERAGRLSGRRFVGPNDWYRDGAKQLIAWQNRGATGGYWVTRQGHGEDHPVVATGLALLFLAKGKRPVAIGKLDHGAKDWDMHPQGVHLLTRRLEKDWRIKLNWQTVRAKSSTVDDLLQTPVIFMSGKDSINLSQKEKENLKLYLENGGFLFAEACQGDGCGLSDEFERSFHELMAEIFPDSELAPLELTHPIWGAQYALTPNADRPIKGLQACCRTSVVFSKKNLSCYWALNQKAIMESPKVRQGLKNRVKYCTRLGVNVMAYATNRKLREKGETPTLVKDDTEILAERALVFPKLLHGGGADDAPNAWRIILQDVKQIGLEMKMDKKLVSATKESLANHPFLFIHGRFKFELSEEERDALRQHLELGGFIFADSICASKAFTDSFRKEMKAILGQSLSPIDPNHEIWLDQRFGRKITEVTLRTKDRQGKFVEKRTRPQLEGAEVGGRLAVVFSPFDLSCALENSSVSQCNGYTREDATKIGTNVILYSMLSEANVNR